MFASKEVALTDGSHTKVHRVGPFTGLNAVMFWGAIVSAVATTVAMATTEWCTTVGLWRWCIGSVCENNPDMVGWFKAVQALVCLALIASVVTLVLAIVYTVLHSVNKNVILTLFIVASWLSALFMIVGVSIFGAKTKEIDKMELGYSFYFAIAAAVFHIVIGIAGEIQKLKSG